MTQPGPLPPPVDPGNPYVLAMELPAALSAVPVQGDNGPRLLVTIRSGGATLTVPLSRDDVMSWCQHLTDAARQLSPLIVAGPGQVPALAPNGHGLVGP